MCVCVSVCVYDIIKQRVGGVHVHVYVHTCVRTEDVST